LSGGAWSAPPLKGGGGGMSGGELALTITVIVFIIILFVMIVVAACYNSRTVTQPPMVEYIFIEKQCDSGSRSGVGAGAGAGAGASDDGDDGVVVTPAALSSSSPMPSRPQQPQHYRARRAMRTAAGTVNELPSDAAAMQLLGDASTPTMLFLYMDGCGFCNKAKPDMAELAAQFPDVQVVALNARNAQNITRDNDITGFPAFLCNFGSQRKMVGYKPKDAMARVMQQAASHGSAGRRIVVSPVRADKGGRGGGARIVVSPVQPDGGPANGAAAAAAGAPEVTEKEAMDLLASDSPKAIVFVYAEWCGFCKKMQPVYDAAVAKYPDVRMVKLDSAKAPTLVKQHKINGFPTYIMNFGSKQESGYKTPELFASTVMSQRDQ